MYFFLLLIGITAPPAVSHSTNTLAMPGTAKTRFKQLQSLVKLTVINRNPHGTRLKTQPRPSSVTSITPNGNWRSDILAGGRNTLFNNAFFHRSNRKGTGMPMQDWHRETFFISFISFLSWNGISISKCHLDDHSPRPQSNTLQLCTAHWNVVPLLVCV